MIAVSGNFRILKEKGREKKNMVRDLALRFNYS